MLKLTKQESREVNGKLKPVRVYTNSITGSETVVYNIFTGKDGQRWWSFEDLFGLPFMRQMAAKKVTELYGHDLALTDILAHTGQLKAFLRSSDPEKYEKAYQKVLELETLSTSMADPVKQCIGLCTVYLLLDDELPDTYHQGIQNQKLTLLSLDLDAQSFFLNWWTDHMKSSGALLKGLSQIASTLAQA